MISERDVALVTEACRGLPEPVGDYLIDDYLTNLVATVVDFQTQTRAVERALEHFSTDVRPTLEGFDDLVELMARWPADRSGNGALARHLFGYDMWTRAQMLRDLAAYFESIGVTDQSALRRWAATAGFERDFEGRVRGLGPAVFQWLVMRQGVDTVKPDVHVHRFVAQVLGRPVSDTDAVEVIVAAAKRLDRKAHRLDWSIWEAGRSASGVAATPAPSTRESDPVPSPADGGLGEELVSFLDNDVGYLAWLAAHPAGYVLNSDRTPNSRYLVLHRASCHTIGPRDSADARTWTTAYRKTCAAALGPLVDWAAARAGGASPCGSCQPRG